MGVDGGAALVPEDDLQPGRLPQQRAEGGAFLGPGPLGAVHVPGVAQHQQLYAVLGDEPLYAGEHLLLPAGVDGVGVARQRFGVVGNGDAGVGVAVVDGHDLHGDVPHFSRRAPPRFFHIGSIIHKMAAGSNRKWDETAKNTGFFCKKRLTGGGKCGIVGITCEWVLSFCALFRFGGAGGDHPAGRQKGVPKRKPNLIRRCR